MKKIFCVGWLYFLAVVMIAVTLAGCGNSETLAGKYYYVDTSGNLHKDGYLDFYPEAGLMIIQNASGNKTMLAYNIDGENIKVQVPSYKGDDNRIS